MSATIGIKLCQHIIYLTLSFSTYSWLYVSMKKVKALIITDLFSLIRYKDARPSIAHITVCKGLSGLKYGVVVLFWF